MPTFHELTVGCVGWALLALALSACDDAPEIGSGSVATKPSGSASALPPLATDRTVIDLDEHGWVVVPQGARAPRPIVLLWDGSSEDTRALCQRWFALANRVPFVLCRRALDGPARPRAAAELRGALRDVKERFRSHVASGSVVFVATGHVVPASLAAIREEPSFFARVVLSSEERVGWSPTLSAVFAKGGGERVLFACRAHGCRQHTAHPIRWLERQGSHGRVTAAEDDAITPADWQWLIQGDPRYRRSPAP